MAVAKLILVQSSPNVHRLCILWYFWQDWIEAMKIIWWRRLCFFGSIFTRLGWKIQIVILMHLTSFDARYEPNDLDAGQGFRRLLRIIGAGALSWSYLSYYWFYLYQMKTDDASCDTYAFDTLRCWILGIGFRCWTSLRILEQAIALCKQWSLCKLVN